MTKPVVFIGTPVYKVTRAQGLDPLQPQRWGSLVGHPAFAQTINELIGEHDWGEAHFFPYIGDADIGRARATILGSYLRREKPWTHLFMVDSDISFHPSTLPGLLSRGLACVGGAYAYKCKEGFKAGRANVRGWPTPPDCAEEAQAKGLFPVKYLSGGHALVTDDLINRLCEAHPELAYEIDCDVRAEGGETFGLWDALYVPKWDRPGKIERLSEDWSFFERVNRLGETCWWDLAADLAHWDGEDHYKIGVGLVPRSRIVRAA